MSDPSFTAPYSADLASTNAESLGKNVTRLIRCSYLLHLRGFQFRLSLLLAAARSSFVGAIRHVVLLGANKKMLRIAARSVVAPMENTKSCGNRTLVNGPREAVRKPSSHFSSPPFADDSVTEFADFGFLPFPATSYFVDLYADTEPIGKWRRFSHFASKLRNRNSSYYTVLGDKKA